MKSYGDSGQWQEVTWGGRSGPLTEPPQGVVVLGEG